MWHLVYWNSANMSIQCDVVEAALLLFRPWGDLIHYNASVTSSLFTPMDQFCFLFCYSDGRRSTRERILLWISKSYLVFLFSSISFIYRQITTIVALGRAPIWLRKCLEAALFASIFVPASFLPYKNIWTKLKKCYILALLKGVFCMSIKVISRKLIAASPFWQERCLWLNVWQVSAAGNNLKSSCLNSRLSQSTAPKPPTNAPSTMTWRRHNFKILEKILTNKRLQILNHTKWRFHSQRGWFVLECSVMLWITEHGSAPRRNLTGESGRGGDDNEHQNPAGPRKRYNSHLRLT